MRERRQCAHQKSDGNRCRAFAQADDRFCFFHSPNLARARRNAQRAGGTTRGKQNVATLATEIPDMPLRNSADICELLSTTIREVRSGKLPPRTATAVGYLANILLGALQQGPLEDRLLALEAALGLANVMPKESTVGAEKSPSRQN